MNQNTPEHTPTLEARKNPQPCKAWAYYDSHGLPGLIDTDRPSETHRPVMVIPAENYAQDQSRIERLERALVYFINAQDQTEWVLKQARAALAPEGTT